SPLFRALAPPGVKTRTGTTPGVLAAGTSALSCVADTNVTVLDATAPNFTIAPGTNPVPVIATVFPPPVTPALGLTTVSAGGSSSVYPSAEDVAVLPPRIPTATSTTPAACTGTVAFNRVADTNVTDDAAVVPNFTLAPGPKLVPVIVTVFPPAVEPAFGLTPV